MRLVTEGISTCVPKLSYCFNTHFIFGRRIQFRLLAIRLEVGEKCFGGHTRNAMSIGTETGPPIGVRLCSGQIEGCELTGYAGPSPAEGRWPSTVLTASSSSGRWHRSTW